MKTVKLTKAGLLFATGLALSLIETALPPIPMTPPGVKLGLSNIAVMLAMLTLSPGYGFALALLKSAFIAMVRGPVSGWVSVAGGLISVAVMAAMIRFYRKKPAEPLPLTFISVMGALAHNIGQLIAVTTVYSNPYLWLNLPILALSAVLTGLLVGAIVKALNKVIKQ